MQKPFEFLDFFLIFLYIFTNSAKTKLGAVVLFSFFSLHLNNQREKSEQKQFLFFSADCEGEKKRTK
jgi:hypothetical protein